MRRLAGDIRIPAKGTVHAELDRDGLVKWSRHCRNKARGMPLSQAANPNQIWSADFKGEFKLGNRKYCYPLTVTDRVSRFILTCESHESMKEASGFQRLFEERRLPDATRNDIWCALRQVYRALQSIKTVRVVAALGQQYRVNQDRPPAAEWTP